MKNEFPKQTLKNLFRIRVQKHDHLQNKTFFVLYIFVHKI